MFELQSHICHNSDVSSSADLGEIDEILFLVPSRSEH